MPGLPPSLDIVLQIVSWWNKKSINISKPTAPSWDMATHIVLDSTIISVSRNPDMIKERSKDTFHMMHRGSRGMVLSVSCLCGGLTLFFLLSRSLTNASTGSDLWCPSPTLQNMSPQASLSFESLTVAAHGARQTRQRAMKRRGWREINFIPMFVADNGSQVWS